MKNLNRKRHFDYSSGLTFPAAVLCLFFLFSSFQNPVFRLIATIPVGSEFFSTDRLGNSYLVSPSNEIDKFNSRGEKTTTQNIKILGKITSLDATNPFEIYTFYKEQNRLVILDNILNQRGVVDFNAAGFIQLSAVCRSFDNGIWIFDLNDLQLKKISKNMEVTIQSGNVKAFTNSEINPDFMLENQNRVFVNNPSHGILVFDLFGGYLKTIPIQGLKNFQVMDDELFYFKDAEFKSFNLKSFRENNIQLPDTSGVKNVRIEKDRFFVLKSNQLNLYSY